LGSCCCCDCDWELLVVVSELLKEGMLIFDACFAPWFAADVAAAALELLVIVVVEVEVAVVVPPPLLLVVDVEVVVVEEARRSGRSPNEMRSALDSSMDNSMTLLSDDDIMILFMLKKNDAVGMCKY
jgi:hypothetical protein